MSPIEKGTIRVEDKVEETRRETGYGFSILTKHNKVILAEGDKEDPGTWRHHTNAWEKGASISVTGGQKRRIIDVPVDYDTGEILQVEPQPKRYAGRPTGKKEELHGVWEKIDSE